MAEQFYIAVNGQSVGPMSIEEIKRHPELKPDVLVWKEGFENWVPASSVPEIAVAFVQRPTPPPPASAPVYPNQPSQQPQPSYGGPSQYRQQKTNWLTWAIVGTVLGLFSCIGLILGIIGIVQANKANNLYNQGLDVEGDAANSTAKTLTIISLVIGGLNLIVILYCLAFLGSMSSIYWWL